MSYSSYAVLPSIANLPRDTNAVEPGKGTGYVPPGLVNSYDPVNTGYTVNYTMPSATSSPAGITGGWVKIGGGAHTEYTSVQVALTVGHVRRRTYQSESESVLFPLRDWLKMAAAAAIAAGLIDSAAATAIASQPANRYPFADAMGDEGFSV